MISVSVHGRLALRQIPEKLGKRCVNIRTVSLFVKLGNLVGPWHYHVHFIKGIVHDRLVGELRLVRKNRRNGLVKLVTCALLVFFVSNLNESVNRIL